MRVPVYSRGSNPSVDRPILRKSVQYATEQVTNFLARWVDPDDWTKGIIARELLPSEKPLTVSEIETALQRMPRLKWQPPQHEAWKRIQRESLIPNVRLLSVSA